MASEQKSHIADHEVHRLPEGSSSAITNVATLNQTLKESDQGVSGVDNGAESAKVEAALPNQAETISLPLPGEETVRAKSSRPADTPDEKLQLDDDITTYHQHDAQSEFSHISVG